LRVEGKTFAAAESNIRGINYCAGTIAVDQGDLVTQAAVRSQITLCQFRQYLLGQFTEIQLNNDERKTGSTCAF